MTERLQKGFGFIFRHIEIIFVAVNSFQSRNAPVRVTTFKGGNSGVRNALANKSSSIHPAANPPPLSKDSNVREEDERVRNLAGILAQGDKSKK